MIDDDFEDDNTDKTPEQIAQDLKREALRRKRSTRHGARLRRHFFAGLLVIVPIAVTIWVVTWLVNLIDGKTRHFLNAFLDRLGWGESTVIPIGFGLLIVIVVICFTGMLASNFVGRQFFGLIENLIRRVPGVSWIYNASHQVSHAFLNRKKNLFSDVVFVEYPRKGIYSIGFVTNRAVPGVQVEGGEPICSVFVPTTPNPTSGFLLFVPESQCTECPMSVEESMKMIISGGVVIPESLVVEMTDIPILPDPLPTRGRPKDVGSLADLG